MASENKRFAFGEVKKHDKNEDCWLILGGKIYDVSSFMDDHPGGSEVLLSATGKDATEDFEDVGHGDNAREMMSKYYIGDIDPGGLPVKHVLSMKPDAAFNPYNSNEFLIKILQFLVPLFILALAFVVRKYTKYD